MSTSTQNNIRNNNSVQANNAALKTSKANKQDGAINFSALFSEAMGNTTPKAQLNTLESQMRQALGKQEEKKKAPESNPTAGEEAQASVWSQRNWNAQATQHSDTTNNTISSTAKPSNTAAKSVESKNSDTPKEAQQQHNKAIDGPKDSANAQAKPQEKQPDTAQNKEAMPTEQATSQARPDNAQPDLQVPQNQVLKDTGVDLRSNNTNTAQPQTQADNTANISAIKDPNAAIDVKVNASTTPNINPAIAQQISAQTGNRIVSAEESSTSLKAGDIKFTTTGQSSLNPSTPSSNIAKGVEGQALIKTPVTQPGFAKELGQTAQWALGKGMSTVDIRINPESFGPVNMRLVQKGQDLQIIIRTQDENSANLMTQAITGLKESMAQSGLQLGQVQIQHGPSNPQQNNLSNGQQQWSQNQGQGGQQQSNNSQAQRGGNTRDTLDEPTNPLASSANKQPPSNSGRGIDLFA